VGGGPTPRIAGPCPRGREGPGRSVSARVSFVSEAEGEGSRAMAIEAAPPSDLAVDPYFGLAKAEDIQPRAPFSSSTSIQTPLRWPVG
jgi:hypothetical protein